VPVSGLLKAMSARIAPNSIVPEAPWPGDVVHTVESLRHLMSSPSFAWTHPLRWRRTGMFASTTAT
jgi:hypothetical protein